MIKRISYLDDYCLDRAKDFLQLKPLMTGEWQSQDISDKPMLATRELLHESFMMALPGDIEQLAERVNPNLPWAEDHFQERVGGEPLNPPPSEQWWPFAQQGNAEHKQGEKFSHTYPERMWPRYPLEDWFWKDKSANTIKPMHGIRYEYGDLQDVVNQLKRGPLTRQAYLPIWFPEDTGAIEGQRVPCTLGYHFIIRGDRLSITYYIRSCDFMRHFRDDVFMAGRLAQWMVEQLKPDHPELGVGDLVMHIVSLHVFEGDEAALHQQVKDLSQMKNQRWSSLF